MEMFSLGSLGPMILEPSSETQPGMLTPYLRLDELLIEHARSLEHASAKNFVGIYLIGSLAVGDFDATSDIDFMVVTNDELCGEEFAAVEVARAIAVRSQTGCSGTSTDNPRSDLITTTRS
jgi:Nucleotidyltransferase domain